MSRAQPNKTLTCPCGTTFETGVERHRRTKWCSNICRERTETKLARARRSPSTTARYNATTAANRQVKQYGITAAQKDAMLMAQGGGCAICGLKKHPSGKALATDHDHVTGKVRSVLCDRCNTSIGKFNDDPSLLEQAAYYLRLHQNAGRVYASLDRMLNLVAKAPLPVGVPMAAKKGKVGTLYLYRAIGPAEFGGMTAEDFTSALDSLKGVDRLEVRINSVGGSVFQALAIYKAIIDFPAREKVAYVDALAASAASFILCAFPTRIIAPDAFVMVHEAQGMMAGTSVQLRKMADLLETSTDTILNIYERRTGSSRETLAKMMKDETWLDATAAVEAGFADTIDGEDEVKKKVTASVDPGTVKMVALSRETKQRIVEAQLLARRIARETPSPAPVVGAP